MMVKTKITKLKSMLKWSKDSDTYLTTVSRHRWSKQIMVKVDKFISWWKPQCWLKAPIIYLLSLWSVCSSWWKPQCWLKAPIIYLLSSWSVCSSDVYRQQSGKCRSLFFILTNFFIILGFSLYIYICNFKSWLVIHIHWTKSIV